ncbi:hypothetical protein MycrhN_1763 [Mycolicibacterium rhodesiae NBB3]|uniref:Uncharacterized protein n=1 Tax=Mycolicibacterium rhodesiae (strain NBB3) TaxID=710685 RepID=G8RLB2_MYCRN|nr:hypothetical protein MycrhN_1763 [Mycolicibacterium rhodesiae NBB3]
MPFGTHGSNGVLYPRVSSTIHVYATSTGMEWDAFLDQQRTGAATVAGGGAPVGADDSPPRHGRVEQTHCAADLAGAGSDSVADVSVGRDGAGWNVLDVFTDVIDDAH